MYKSRFRSTLMLAAALTCAVADSIGRGASYVIDVVQRVARRAAEFLVDVFVGPISITKHTLATAEKPLLKVKEFSLRILRRERPRFEAGWRMCPSI